MIVCPNCNHSNPDGAQACEACYTPLPATTSCPNCGAPVQTDATFCGQCGSNLSPSSATEAPPTVTSTQVSGTDNSPSIPEPTPIAPTAMSVNEEPPEAVSAPVTSSEVSAGQPSPPTLGISKTQLQQQTSRLLHVQTDTLLDLPQNLSVIHIGKSNDRIPPDIDVSGFPNSEIVSRIHADIRVEGDAYYIEDVGSSNGTYINNMPLLPGNRHRLRPGDRIALGKGDLVTLIFQS